MTEKINEKRLLPKTDCVCMVVNLLAIALRLLIWQTPLANYIELRPEIVNPLNSFVRLREGIALWNDGISPYDGDTYHGAPLFLYIMRTLWNASPYLVYILFPICDLIAANLLASVIQVYTEAIRERDNEVVDVLDETLMDRQRSTHTTSKSTVIIAYLFNPITIAACVGCTMTTINNAVIATALYFMIKKHFWPCLICVAAIAYLDFYLFMLLAPVTLWFAGGGNGKPTAYNRRFWLSVVIIVLKWLMCLSVFMALSVQLTGSWNFLQSTYGFILAANDLTPNYGLYWYFFTEVFSHFRLFFIWVFQINVVIYTIPLTICLRDDAVFLFKLLVGIAAVFKSYPSFGDAALVLAFLQGLNHLRKFCRQFTIAEIALFVSIVLAPVMWHMWIYTGSGNANFYFASSIIYSTGHIFLLTDLLYGHLKRQVHKFYNMDTLEDPDNTEIILK